MSDTFEKDFATTLFRNLLDHDEFLRKVIPHLKPDYFGSLAEKCIFDKLSAYVEKYNTAPDVTIIRHEVYDSPLPGMSPKDSTEMEDYLIALDAGTGALADSSIPWLIDQTEDWCKNRALYNAIMESLNIYGGNSKNAEGIIPELMTKALAVSFDTKIGHDYFEDFEHRWDFYHKHEFKIPLDLEILNRITKGGVSKKTLNVLLASTGVGKSHSLCHFAASYLRDGKNVLYLTMEMSEERIAERIDENIFGLKQEDLHSLSKSSFGQQVMAAKKKTSGRLQIKEYPTGSAHVGHFRALLHDLKLKRNFVPDVIIVDYLNICASSRIRGLGGNVGSYHLVKAIAEELRGLAIEFNVPVWTATQTNRDGANNSDVDLTNTSESWGLPQTADLMLALIMDSRLAGMGQMMVKQLKNRYGNINEFEKFLIGCDREKMRLFDLDNPTSGLIADEQASKAETTSFKRVVKTPFAATKGGRAASDLQV